MAAGQACAGQDAGSIGGMPPAGPFAAGQADGCMAYPEDSAGLAEAAKACWPDAPGQGIGAQAAKVSEGFARRWGAVLAGDGKSLRCLAWVYRGKPALASRAVSADAFEWLPQDAAGLALMAWRASAECSLGQFPGKEGLARSAAKEAFAAAMAFEQFGAREAAAALERRAMALDMQFAMDNDPGSATGSLVREFAAAGRQGAGDYSSVMMLAAGYLKNLDAAWAGAQKAAESSADCQALEKLSYPGGLDRRLPDKAAIAASADFLCSEAKKAGVQK